MKTIMPALIIFLIMVSQIAHGDEALKSQLACLAAITKTYEKIQPIFENGCRIDKDKLVFLADRHAQKGAYLFDTTTQKSVFLEFTPGSASLPRTSDKIPIITMLYAFSGKKRLVYRSIYTDGKGFTAREASVSDEEIEQFIKRKGIPEGHLANPKIRDKIHFFLKASKEKVFDPNSPDHRKRTKYESLSCLELKPGEVAALEELGMESHDANDQDTVKFLNEMLHQALSFYVERLEMTRSSLDLTHTFHRDFFKAPIEKCANVQNEGIRNSVAKLREILFEDPGAEEKPYRKKKHTDTSTRTKGDVGE
ncbi:MAG: hypothetical protein AB1540_10435 [Bdellovibrionota bacterium]